MLSEVPQEQAETERVINVLFACFPKSGSTFISKLFEKITGFPCFAPVQSHGQTEQDLFEPILKQMAQQNSVTQQHVKAAEYNIMLMKKYGIKPVVLVRNIFDVVLSIHDHFETGDYHTPLGYIHKRYYEMSRDDKLMFIIHICIPWYFNFYVSWWEASNEFETLWISYAQIFEDLDKTVFKILKYYGLSATLKDIEQAVAAMKYEDMRFNKGLSGRGKSLTKKHKDAIFVLADSWKLDMTVFDMIGLG